MFEDLKREKDYLISEVQQLKADNAFLQSQMEAAECEKYLI